MFNTKAICVSHAMHRAAHAFMLQGLNLSVPAVLGVKNESHFYD